MRSSSMCRRHPSSRRRGRCISARSGANQALGIGDKMHKLMFDGVWKTGEISYSDPTTNRIKSRLPTIEDSARRLCRQAWAGSGR